MLLPARHAAIMSNGEFRALPPEEKAPRLKIARHDCAHPELSEFWRTPV